jgi:hypothetical protein
MGAFFVAGSRLQGILVNTSYKFESSDLCGSSLADEVPSSWGFFAASHQNYAGQL